MSEEKIIEPTPEELVKIIDDAIANFAGNSERLKNAIGMLMLARNMGWKPVYLIHSRGTVREYEKILGGIDIQKRFNPVGPLARKSIVWSVVSKLSNFWKAVKGEYPGLKTNSTELA